MRLSLSVFFGIMILALFICWIFAKRSIKAIGNSVAFVLAGMILPVLGNLMIIATSNEFTATFGYYIYFIGMDTAVYSVLHFTYAYCEFGTPRRSMRALIGSLFGLDFLQYIANPFLHLSFCFVYIYFHSLPVDLHIATVTGNLQKCNKNG